MGHNSAFRQESEIRGEWDAYLGLGAFNPAEAPGTTRNDHRRRVRVLVPRHQDGALTLYQEPLVYEGKAIC